MRPYGGAFRILTAVISAYSGFRDFCPFPSSSKPHRWRYSAPMKEALREVSLEREHSACDD
jgi:hypothetical protein